MTRPLYFNRDPWVHEGRTDRSGGEYLDRERPVVGVRTWRKVRLLGERGREGRVWEHENSAGIQDQRDLTKLQITGTH